MKGDRRAQNELYRYCYSFLISVCWRYAADKDEALQYMNIGFLKIITSLSARKTDVPFDHWCRRIMINTIIDEFRKSKNYDRHIQRYRDEGMELIHEEQDISDWQTEMIERIMSIIHLLPPMTAKVFNLYAIDGYKHQEIAEQLRISEGTSMWHYAEAKRRIRDMIAIRQSAQ